MNPFPESIKIGEYIAANTSQNDRVAIIDSEPQIYFYSNRRGASGYIDMISRTETDYVWDRDVHQYAPKVSCSLLC